MIVVNLNKSYPHLLQASRIDAFALQNITVGDWPKLKTETLAGFDDLLVGTYEDLIVSAFRITGANTVDYEGTDKTRFEVAEPVGPTGDPFSGLFHRSSFEPAAWLIGCPIPGGSWKKGEARGTRRYSLDDYRTDHPDLADREQREFGSGTAEELLQHLRGNELFPADDYPALATADRPSGVTPGTGVTVVRQPGGTVIVTIPTGTRAHIEIEPN